MVAPGLLTTVQDAGRPAAAVLGVPRGGACDPDALAIANGLLGNAAVAPALESTLGGLSLVAERTTVVAIAGANLDARIVEEERHVTPGTAVLLRAGTTLELSGARSGARTYVAVPGGLDVPTALGSAAAALAAGFPGLLGRAVRAGDVLMPRRPGDLSHAGRRWPHRPGPAAPPVPLRVVPGPHREALGAAAAVLVAATWRVGEASDRSGVRLEADASVVDALVADTEAMGEIASMPMTWGAVQVPPGGVPICLLPDHGTLGGYPVPLVVATVDRAALGQLRPGETVVLREVAASEARRLLLEARAGFARAAAALSGDSDWDAAVDAAG